MQIEPKVNPRRILSERSLPRTIPQVGELIADAATELRLYINSRSIDVRCRAQPNSCSELHSRYLYMAITATQLQERLARDEFGLKDCVKRSSHEEVVAKLYDVLSRSTDELERIAAHYFLRFGLRIEQPAFPAAAYRDLISRPVPEIDIMGQWHTRTPVAPSVEGEFAALAQSEDSRIRRAGLVALGHPENARALDTALRESVLGRSRSDWHHAARATMRCGRACLDAASYLMSLGEQPARIALYEGLALAPEADRAVFAEVLLSTSTSDVDAKEIELRNELMAAAMN